MKDVAAQYPKTQSILANWIRIVRSAIWKSFSDVRETFPKADQVRVESGHTDYVFNICGGEYRLITAIHFDRQRLYTLRFFTHSEYDKEKWKFEL